MSFNIPSNHPSSLVKYSNEYKQTTNENLTTQPLEDEIVNDSEKEMSMNINQNNENLTEYLFYQNCLRQARDFLDRGQFLEALEQVSIFSKKFPHDEEALKIQSICKCGGGTKIEINKALQQKNFSRVCELAFNFLNMCGPNSKIEQILQRGKLLVEIEEAFKAKHYAKTIQLTQRHLKTYGEYSHVKMIEEQAEPYVEPFVVTALKNGIELPNSD